MTSTAAGLALAGKIPFISYEKLLEKYGLTGNDIVATVRAVLGKNAFALTQDVLGG